MKKPRTFTTYTLRFPGNKLNIDADGAFRLFKTRRQAEWYAADCSLFDETNGKWPKVIKVRITVEEVS